MSVQAEIATWLPAYPWRVEEEAGELILKDANGRPFGRLFSDADGRQAHVAQAVQQLPQLMLAADATLRLQNSIGRECLRRALWAALGRIEGGD